MTFRLVFRNGTSGVLTVAEATPASTRLALYLDPPVAADRPFAALRSMFVTPAPGGRRGRRLAGGRTPRRYSNSAGSTRASARFGRVEQSHHNLSAPDLVFDGFATAAAR